MGIKMVIITAQTAKNNGYEMDYDHINFNVENGVVRISNIT